MKVIDTFNVENGPILLEPEIHKDERGYFFESFNQMEFEEKTGFHNEFVQENQSKSCYGTLRGMHCQTGKHAQAKLVSVVKGAVIDVIVDARKDSENYGKVYWAHLSEENHRQFLVPAGFLHGFITLANNTIFQYKCDSYYNKESENSALWSSIDFPWTNFVPKKDIILSEKDKNAKPFDYEKNENYYI